MQISPSRLLTCMGVRPQPTMESPIQNIAAIACMSIPCKALRMLIGTYCHRSSSYCSSGCCTSCNSSCCSNRTHSSYPRSCCSHCSYSLVCFMGHGAILCALLNWAHFFCACCVQLVYIVCLTLSAAMTAVSIIRKAYGLERTKHDGRLTMGERLLAHLFVFSKKLKRCITPKPTWEEESIRSPLTGSIV